MVHSLIVKKTFFSKMFILFGMLFSSFILAFSLSTNGVFQDTKNYYQLYHFVAEIGIYESYINFTLQTGKPEPIIFFIFKLISSIFGKDANEFTFIFSFLFVLNVLFFLIVISIQKLPIKSLSYYFIVGVIIILSHLVYSEELYFWRSLLGGVFFLGLFFSLNSKIKLFVFSFLSILSHLSFVFFVILFFIFKYINFSKGKMILILFFSVLCLCIIMVDSNLVSFVISGDSVNAIFSVGSFRNTFNTFVSIIFSLIILSLLNNPIKHQKELIPLYNYTIFIIILSILSIHYYQLMNRIFLLPSIVVSFLPFIMSVKSNNVLLARLLVFISIVPSLRLVYLMLTGSFAHYQG